MARKSRRAARAAVGTVTVALAMVLGGCGGGGDGGDGGEESPTSQPTRTVTASPSPTASLPRPSGMGGRAAQVSLRPDDDLGKILTRADGRTLYLFVADASEQSTCYDACAEVWPPLTVEGKPKAGKGVRSGLLGTTQRNDGSKQVTYNGHPLYTYAEDEEPGETDGQGLDQFGAVWWVVDASGNKVEDEAGDDQDEQEDQDGGSY